MKVCGKSKLFMQLTLRDLVESRGAKIFSALFEVTGLYTWILSLYFRSNHILIGVPSTIRRGWNRRFHSETHQMFSVHTAPEKFEVVTITGHLDLFSRKTQDHVIIGASRFRKVAFKMFAVHTRKCKADVFKFVRFEEHFRKVLFWWRIRPNHRNKLCFQISPAYCGPARALNAKSHPIKNPTKTTFDQRLLAGIEQNCWTLTL